MKEVLYSLALIVLISCFSCATKRIAVPQISETPREGLLLNNPVIFSLLDARTDKEKSQEILSSIKNGLTNVYGSSTEWAEYFERVPRGKVAVKIRLKANEANFGTRLIPVTYVETSFSTTLSTVSTKWSTVVSAASTQQTTFSTSFIPQGYWVGTSWLELEIIDNRFGNPEKVNFPIVAEQTEANTWGYKSASNATKKSWNTVSQHLIQVLDTIFLTLRDQDY